MSRTLTEEELASWRAKRTGKPMPSDTSDATVRTNAHGGPDAPKLQRHPLEGVAGFDATDDLPLDEPVVQHTPAPNSQEAEELRQQLAAANGRLGPVQRQFEEMRALVETQSRQLAEFQSQLAAKQADETAARTKAAADSFNPLEGLSQDQIDMLDPAALKLIESAARNAYSKAASQIKDPEALIQQVLAKRDAQARDAFIRATADTLSLSQLSNDSKFTKFLAEDDSAGLLLNSFINAQDIDAAKLLEPRVRTMLKRFEKSTNSTRTPDPQDRAAAHLDRAPQGTQARSNAGPRTAEQVRAIQEQAKRLSRARKFKEANELLASINN